MQALRGRHLCATQALCDLHLCAMQALCDPHPLPWRRSVTHTVRNATPL